MHSKNNQQLRHHCCDVWKANQLSMGAFCTNFKSIQDLQLQFPKFSRPKPFSNVFQAMKNEENIQNFQGLYMRNDTGCVYRY